MGTARKRRFGDRKEGRRLRTLDPYHAFALFIMKSRGDASNHISDSIEISKAEKFLRGKKINGYPGIGMLQLVIAAYIRVVSQYPAVNRFVSGQRLYARNNIEFVMTIKKEMKSDAPETSVKVYFEPGDTINDVYHKLKVEIDKVKSEGEATDTDDVAKVLMKIPRPLLKFAVRFLEIMDYFGKLPKSLLKASPFHGSVIITDLGSLGLPSIYHHLYNFGNLPVFIALSAKRKAHEFGLDGAVVERKYLDYKLVADERICDGFYFSKVLKLFKNLMQDPQVLESPPETIVEDID